MFKLDRTIGQGHTHEKATKSQSDYWKSKTPGERLKAAMYRNSIVYGFDPENPPRMDKTIGSSRKHKV